MERKLQRISNSLLVTLPQEWVKENKLTKGRKLNIETKDNILMISIQPIKKENINVTTSLDYDSSFIKIFLREYINGTDTVIVNNISKSNIKLAYEFIKDSVINAQIIEEKNNQITIKIFEAKDFDSNICFRRIINITDSLFHDIIENDFEEVKKRDAILGQFYFLLLRQINNRLSTHTNESKDLIKIWLCCEKLELIGDILKRINNLSKTDTIYAEEVYDFYKKTINAFIKKDINQSRELWKRRKCLSIEHHERTETRQYLQIIVAYISFINNLI